MSALLLMLNGEYTKPLNLSLKSQTIKNTRLNPNLKEPINLKLH